MCWVCLCAEVCLCVASEHGTMALKRAEPVFIEFFQLMRDENRFSAFARHGVVFRSGVSKSGSPSQTHGNDAKDV